MSCGTCTYEIVGEPIVVAHCHCLDCQKLSGAGHTTGAFSEDGIKISGEPRLYSLTSEGGNTVTRVFCGTCGSQLFGRNKAFLLIMASGSIIGTFVGGKLLGIIPSGLLLPALAVILLISAVKVWRHA